MTTRTCEICGAFLDAGERCDCTAGETRKAKQIRLISLELHNFQGIADMKLTFNGKNADIFGDNASGKTTIFNAFTWLLCDKASTGAKGFSPKTKTAYGEMHRAEHSAEAVFEIDGEPSETFTLKKIFREVYKKKRGSVHEEFDGHTTDYFYDGVPCKEKEYLGHIEEQIGDTQRIMLLAMVDFFPAELPWEKRRAILLDICGDCTGADIISEAPELSALPQIVGRHSVEEYAKIAAAAKCTINGKIEEIPVRIDEIKRTMHPAEFDIETLKAKLDAAQTEEKRIITTAQNTSAAAEKARLETEKENARYAYIGHCDKERIEHSMLLHRKLETCKKKADAVDELERKIARSEQQRTEMRAKRERLITEWETIKATEWQAASAICPTCHRPLPEDEVEQLKAEFNRKKSEQLQEINERGKQTASAEQIAEIEKEIAGLHAELTTLQGELDALKADYESTRENAPTMTPFETTDTCRYYDEQIAKVGNDESTAEYERLLAETRNNIAILQGEIVKAEHSKQAEQRIAELEDELHRLTTEYEKAEHEISLCELFIKTKVSMLNAKINSHFKRVRFSLFSEQLNGGLKPECEVLIPSESGSMIPYQYANNAAKINAGLEIISTLAEYYGIGLPVFIDNAESVTRLLPIAEQTIRLVVSETDKQLRLQTTI